jgi:hypothetical protein
MDYLKALFNLFLIGLCIALLPMIPPFGFIAGSIGGYFLYKYLSSPIRDQCNGLVVRPNGVQFGRCLNTGVHKDGDRLYCDSCWISYRKE